ncbi:MAG: four-helix bundle copper-binding protein [Methylobacter sp.]|nr:four-helix bundle copper-binding protein [Methylobacter sp.]
MGYSTQTQSTPRTQATHTGAGMQSCIDACNRCYQVCFQTAMNQCLEMGGQHVEAEHFRLMMNCAEICRTSVNFQLSNSRFQYRLCEVCAEVCEACAMDCERIGGMDECVQVCRECAQSCRDMASTQH